LAVGAEAVSDARHMSVLVRYPDIVAVVLAAIPALAFGAPVLGYALGGGVWILQRVLQANESRLVGRFSGTQRVGAKLAAAFGRIWLMAGAIIVAGVAGHDKDGLTAAVVIFAAYTLAFSVRIISGPPPRSEV
jgi:hypothetical protein